MTPPSGIAIRLQELIATWREEAKKRIGSIATTDISDYGHTRYGHALQRCADDLDALIAASASPSSPVATVGPNSPQAIYDLANKVADASPSSEIHRDCHDLACNGDRRHPRGTKGTGCSCRARDASLSFSETTQVCSGQSATLTMESNNLSEQASASVEPSASTQPETEGAHAMNCQRWRLWHNGDESVGEFNLYWATRQWIYDPSLPCTCDFGPPSQSRR